MSQHHDDFAVSDVEYNLITTLSNLLQAEDALHKYISDAESAGASDVASLFQDLHESNRRVAKQMRQVLHDQFMNK
jgi:rubrerythrin